MSKDSVSEDLVCSPSASGEASSRPRAASNEFKAYSVLEECENTGGIVFAKHAITARKDGASLYNGGEFYGMSCRRAHWADKYASEGTVPAKLMIEHGWHFECSGCSQRIDEHWLDDKGLPLDGVIGEQNGPVFCCRRCEVRHDKREKRREEQQAAAIKMLRRMVLKRFPNVAFVVGRFNEHAFCTEHKGAWVIEQAVVSFDFPGMKYGPACLRLDRGAAYFERIGPVMPEYSCCYGDRGAFNAFVEAARVSDEQPKAEDRNGLSAEHASTTALAGTPQPSHPTQSIRDR
jgi:hypothetical protein